MPRWWVKQLARRGVALGSWASGALSPRRAVGGLPRIRALTYHRVGRERREPFCVTPEAFDAHVRFLSERGLAVSLAQVRRFVAGREELPDGACLVTIDDGWSSLLTEALPILARWRVPAVAYVTTALVGERLDAHPERYATWDELRRVAASGLVEIGSHASTHRSLGRMDPREAREEVRRSREELEDHLGCAVTSFAYPFGTRGDFTPVTERVLAEAGYELAFNSMHGPIRPGMDPISLPRVKVEGGEGLWMFRLLSQGAMDAWRVVDENLFHLQRVRTEIGAPRAPAREPAPFEPITVGRSGPSQAPARPEAPPAPGPDPDPAPAPGPPSEWPDPPPPQ